MQSNPWSEDDGGGGYGAAAADDDVKLVYAIQYNIIRSIFIWTEMKLNLCMLCDRIHKRQC